jgi:hypothetical protein
VADEKITLQKSRGEVGAEAPNNSAVCIGSARAKVAARRDKVLQ